MAVDISTDTGRSIYGVKWFEFLASSRATVGCESGSSMHDVDGSLRAHIDSMCAKSQTVSYEEIVLAFPPGWDTHRFFAISPRHFEAVATRTLQILVEGDYSGVLEPWRHYIPIKRDFSDMDEAVARIEDRVAAEKMIERAHADIYRSRRYGYETLATAIEEVMTRRCPPPRLDSGSATAFAFKKLLTELPEQLRGARAGGRALILAGTTEIGARLFPRVFARTISRNVRGISSRRQKELRVILFHSSRLEHMEICYRNALACFASSLCLVVHDRFMVEYKNLPTRVTVTPVKGHPLMSWEALYENQAEALREFGADVALIPVFNTSFEYAEERLANIIAMAHQAGAHTILFINLRGAVRKVGK